MQFIQGKQRSQSILFPESLDEIIEKDNEVRIIDLFVESINVADFKFVIKTTKEGRPAYHPKDLLKLFVYGYLNHIRSSRQLGKEGRRNIEVMWLLRELTPDHNTISNFRRDKADEDSKESIAVEIQKHEDRKEFYENISQQLSNSGEVQISTSDPDSRQLITRNNITEVAYNVQTAADAKHNLLIDYKVTNQNDSRAMSGMLRRAKTILGTSDFTALYDKGYHTGSEIKRAIDLKIEIMVAVPGVASNAPDESYNVTHFKYDEVNDSYTCPQDQILNTNGNWYQKNKERYFYFVKHYKTSACASCPVNALCTKNAQGRLIERSEYAPYIERNRLNIEASPEIYKKRQAIVEHPYGTIKRQWGFSYIITKKGMKRASADVGLMFIAYNLRRLMNIIDTNLLKKFLGELAFFLSGISASIKSTSFKISHCIFNQRIMLQIRLASGIASN